MPRFNGAGPAGMGPMTGGGRGRCAPGTQNRGFGGLGSGRGGQGGWGRRNQLYATGLPGWQRANPGEIGLNKKEETDFLKNQAEYLSRELEAIRSRLSELEQKK